MPIYPTPRLLVLLSLGVIAALAIGMTAPGLWAWTPVVGVLLFLLGVLDGLFAPIGLGLTLDASLPSTLGLGRPQDVPFRFRFAQRAPAEAEVRFVLPHLLAGASTWNERLKRGDDGAFAGQLTLKSSARGRADIEAAFVRWRGKLGLVYVQTRVAIGRTVVITPDIKGVEQDASDLFSLDSLYGVRIQNQLFNGSEYHALREYDSSQDHRRIDWRSSARHLKLYAREYQAERNHHIVLAYDTGRLMGEPLGGLKRLDRAIYAGLLIGYTALKIGDNVRTFAFDTRPQAVSPSIAGVRGFSVLKYQLSALEDTNEETNHTLALADLNANVARRSLIILFSDFIDEISADLMVESLNRLSKTHLVLFVAFRDEVVEDLMARRPAASADITRAVFARRLATQRETVFARLRRQGIEVLEAPTEAMATAIVNKYLALKRADRL